MSCSVLYWLCHWAWYGANGWLQDFAYRVKIAWWVFALAGLSTFVLALATIGVQSVKSALTNPVNCLKDE